MDFLSILDNKRRKIKFNQNRPFNLKPEIVLRCQEIDIFLYGPHAHYYYSLILKTPGPFPFKNVEHLEKGLCSLHC